MPPLDLNPIVINAPVVGGPSGLRAGQTLTLQAGGSLGDDFAVVDATLNVEAGTVGDALEVLGSEVNISGATLGDSFDAFSGSEVNISGGTLGDNFDAFSGSEVNISGGTLGRNANAFSGSVVNISGGTVDFGFEAFSGSEVNISGGTFGAGFRAFSGSVVNIFGSEFYIDGVELNAGLLGQAVTITDQDVTLSGVLADGEPFSFDLRNSVRGGISPDATLTVTLTAPCLLGDCDLNGVVNFSDIAPFIMILQSGSFLKQADCNQDDVVDFSDIPAFIAILASN